MQTPETPIPVMQLVGHALGISPDKMTKDKLMVVPISLDEVVHDD
jgi:hypothetical protein